ncbi:amino-acid N-acetyltransferase [Pseudomonadales bacterium]|nr:amino-acid N-acetyltransferase [Pseudomonadales bacterium]
MNELFNLSGQNANSDESSNGSQDYTQLIRWFRQATPYINAHRGKTFVVMLSGEAVADNNISNIIHDIALLNSLGTRIVIVHGVRAQLDAQLKQLNINSQFVQGMRVSDQATMDAAIQASSLIRSQLETRLSMGLANSPMHGARVRVASANVITAKPAGIIDGVDLQHTGLVRKIDTVAMNTLLDLGNVVLLSPLGYSPTGEAFSLSYQQVASEIAIALQADKLIAFTHQDGICNKKGELIRELNPTTAQANIAEQNPDNEFIRCAKTAIASVEGGVPRAHLMNYADDGALLQELYTVDGAGTLILSANFEVTRQANAEDIPAIIDIISPLEEQGVLVKRERDKLEDEINYFTVIEREGLIIALAALYPYAENNGEIACIVTHPDYRNGARGANLLNTIETNARAEGINKVFVLTTQTAHWFIENGFHEGGLDDLPEEKQSLYNYQRNSKVLSKQL